ncbi:MAG: transporter substrate-binding domain-containing protein [Deltaproteobacteria bacterium]|jgi:polar amino acid transport system substrate-binding protein|nr:transporter substrate-binding domain-containing protein [Deltaproteobacteria bacterium]
MMISGKIYGRAIIFMFLLLSGLTQHALAEKKPNLQVAISLDIPPYVIDNASRGLEVDIVRQALEDYQLHFIQIPYLELQTAVQEGRVDVAIGVQQDDNDVHYSVDFITFANYAISKKADGLQIEKVADLRNHRVLTWGNAYLELGSEFEAMFSPGAPQRRNYTEFPDQEEQVREFWELSDSIIIIDQSIFNYFSRKLGHDLSKANFHDIFPPRTNFKAGFKTVAILNRFNEGLIEMCKSGNYAKLLQQYDVAAEQTLCE